MKGEHLCCELYHLVQISEGHKLRKELGLECVVVQKSRKSNMHMHFRQNM